MLTNLLILLFLPLTLALLGFLLAHKRGKMFNLFHPFEFLAAFTIPQGKFEGFQPQGLWPSLVGLFYGGRNTAIKAIQNGSVTFTAALVAAASIAEQAITVTGLTTNDIVSIVGTGAPTANVNLLGHGRVSAANTLQALYINPTAGGLTPPAAQVIFFLAVQIQ